MPREPVKWSAEEAALLAPRGWSHAESQGGYRSPYLAKRSTRRGWQTIIAVRPGFYLFEHDAVAMASGRLAEVLDVADVAARHVALAEKS